METGTTKTEIKKELGEQIVKGNITGPIEVIFGEHAQPLPFHEETPVKLGGILENVAEWAEQRAAAIDPKGSYLMVDRDKMKIEFITDERNHFKNELTGGLSFHPIYLLFDINGCNFITAQQLGDKIKMNRFYFENKTEAMTLNTTLRNFVAKVDKEVEQKSSSNGDRRQLRAQTVQTNLPPSFHLVIPIFKGQKALKLQVEIEINPDDLTCRLVSPEAAEEAENVKNTAIDAVINRVQAVLPGIAVLEK